MLNHRSGRGFLCNKSGEQFTSPPPRKDESQSISRIDFDSFKWQKWSEHSAKLRGRVRERGEQSVDCEIKTLGPGNILTVASLKFMIFHSTASLQSSPFLRGTTKGSCVSYVMRKLWTFQDFWSSFRGLSTAKIHDLRGDFNGNVSCERALVEAQSWNFETFAVKQFQVSIQQFPLLIT